LHLFGFYHHYYVYKFLMSFTLLLLLQSAGH